MSEMSLTIFQRMLPNWHPSGRCCLHPELGGRMPRLCCLFWRDSLLSCKKILNNIELLIEFDYTFLDAVALLERLLMSTKPNNAETIATPTKNNVPPPSRTAALRRTVKSLSPSLSKTLHNSANSPSVPDILTPLIRQQLRPQFGPGHNAFLIHDLGAKVAII